jgi:hypothetical protein
MKKKSLVSLICLLLFAVSFVLVGSLSAEAASKTKSTAVKKTAPQPAPKQVTGSEKIEDTFTKFFPRVPFDAIKPTGIKGIYEVSKGAELIYFIPDSGNLFIGDMISKEGKNLTVERKGELLAEKA